MDFIFNSCVVDEMKPHEISKRIGILRNLKDKLSNIDKLVLDHLKSTTGFDFNDVQKELDFYSLFGSITIEFNKTTKIVDEKERLEMDGCFWKEI